MTGCRCRTHTIRNPRLIGKTGAAVAAALMAAGLGLRSFAADSTWTGGGATFNWSEGGNWGGTAPSSSIDTRLFFDGTTIFNIHQDISTDFLLNDLTFNATAGGAFHLDGNPLDFRASSASVAPSINQNSSHSQLIFNNLVLTDTLNVGGSGHGQLDIEGLLSGAGGLNVSNTPSTVVFTGGTSATPSSISFLAISNANSLLAPGALSLSSTGSTGASGNSSLFVGTGGTFEVGGAVLNTVATPQINNNGQVTITNNATWINSTASGANEIRVGYAGGTARLSLTDLASLTTGGLRLGNAENILNVGHGLISLDNSTATADVLILDDTAGAINLNNNASLNVNTFNMVQNGTTISLGNGAALNVGANNSSTTFSATLSDLASQTSKGTFAKNGSGTLIMSGVGSAFSGNFNLNAGIMGVASDTALGGGTIIANGGSLFASAGDRTLNNAISLNTGSALNLINVTGDQHNLGLNGVISGAGGLTINTPGNTVTIGGSSPNTFSGLTSITAGSLVASKTGGGAISGDLSIGNTVNPGAPASVVASMLQGGQLGTASTASNVTIFSDGLLQLNATTTNTIGSLNLTSGKVNGSFTLAGERSSRPGRGSCDWDNPRL